MVAWVRPPPTPGGQKGRIWGPGGQATRRAKMASKINTGRETRLFPPLSPHPLQLGRSWQGRTRQTAALHIRGAVAVAAAQMGGHSLRTSIEPAPIVPASTRPTVATLEACLGSWKPTSSSKRVICKQEFRLVVVSRSYCDLPALAADLHSERRFDAVLAPRCQRAEVIGSSINSLGHRKHRAIDQDNPTMRLHRKK